MTLLLAAEQAGILGRACELVDGMLVAATEQISTGAAQLRSYRIWVVRGRMK
jgi:hypothetical protein